MDKVYNYFIYKRTKDPGTKSWYKKNSDKLTFYNGLLTVILVGLGLWFSHKNISELKKQLKLSNDEFKNTIKQQRNDSVKNIETDNITYKRNRSLDSSQHKALNASIKQSNAIVDQLQTQKLTLDYALKYAAPQVDLSDFIRIDTSSVNEYFKLKFINVGGRRCKLIYLSFSIVNKKRSFETTFPIPLYQTKLNYRTEFVQNEVYAPISIANDKSTLYYFELKGTDELTNKIFTDTGYIKNPIVENGILSLDSYTINDFKEMHDYLERNKRGEVNSTGQSVFNRDPRDLNTVLVGNATTNPCKAGKEITGCWTDSVSVKNGDLVSVQIYFHNCSTFTARKVVIGMNPQITSYGRIHVFNGVIAEDNGIVRGKGKFVSKDSTRLVFIPNSVRLYTNQSKVGSVMKNELYLFSKSGIDIGDIKRGWNGQGVLTADFKVYSK
jgi:hypothetical protein